MIIFLIDLSIHIHPGFFMKMKKSSISTIACMTICFLAMMGCSRESIRTEESAMSLQGASGCPSRAEFVAGKSMREYLLAYRELSPADRLCMWQNKLSHSVQFFDDQEQVNFIKNSANLLTLSYVEHGNPVGFEESFIDDAKRYFTFEQVARVFMVLHDYDHPPLPMAPNQQGGGNTDCECLYSIYCGVLGYCNYHGCMTAGGCGIFGGSSCKGMCEGSTI
jgi:hypothetical protein